jgi:RND family efflux transporter MFP subunit
LTAVLVAACQPQAAEEADTSAASPRVVWVEPAVKADGHDLTFSGTVHARSDAPSAFRVGGKISERLVDVGDRVTAGQRLASLDEEDLRASLRAREAEERAAQAQARRTAEDRTRIAALQAKGHVSQSALDQAVAADDAAAAALKAASEQRILAENQLAYATLRADRDGVVTAVTAEPGEVVTAGQGIVRIAGDSEREVEVAIPEAQVAGLEAARASVTLWASPDRLYQARLRELSPVADAAARTFTARFAIDDPTIDARLGMTATVHLQQVARQDEVAVPLTAVWYSGDAPNVWRADPGAEHVEAVPVKVHRIEAERAVISGLEPGAHVVSLGVHRIDPGLTLKAVLRESRGPVQVGALR